MSRKISPSIIAIAIVPLLLISVFSLAWATTYSASKVMNRWGGIIPIHVDSDKSAIVTVLPTALDDYLDEQDLTEVEITVEMQEFDDGLTFVFGPSGCHFEPPLMLSLTGDFITTEDFTLYDENGEELEYHSFFDGQAMVFEIDHFSCYYYEEHCY